MIRTSKATDTDVQAYTVSCFVRLSTIKPPIKHFELSELRIECTYDIIAIMVSQKKNRTSAKKLPLTIALFAQLLSVK
jgi:hypothetical protein